MFTSTSLHRLAGAVFVSVAAFGLIAALNPSGAAAQGAPLLFQSGVEIFAPVGGSSTLEAETTLGEMSMGAEKLERDETSGLGYTAWGLFNVIPLIGCGLALHYIPTLEFEDNDKTSYTYGSSFDLNVMVAANLPIPVVKAMVFVEGGGTIVSLDDEFAKSLGGDADNEAGIFGYNVGGGVKVGYKFIPAFGINFGLAYQYYSAAIFEGSTSDPTFGDQTTKADLSGNRVRLDFGVTTSF